VGEGVVQVVQSVQAILQGHDNFVSVMGADARDGVLRVGGPGSQGKLQTEWESDPGGFLECDAYPRGTVLELGCRGDDPSRGPSQRASWTGKPESSK
jgi:hypothetical protein